MKLLRGVPRSVRGHSEPLPDFSRRGTDFFHPSFRADHEPWLSSLPYVVTCCATTPYRLGKGLFSSSAPFSHIRSLSWTRTLTSDSYGFLRVFSRVTIHSPASLWTSALCGLPSFQRLFLARLLEIFFLFDLTSQALRPRDALFRVHFFPGFRHRWAVSRHFPHDVFTKTSFRCFNTAPFGYFFFPPLPATGKPFAHFSVP